LLIPSTHSSALSLLVVALVCLGSWANTLKLTGNRWRFEFFYLDFSVGALLVAALAGFTLGSSGNELGIGDRALVAGRMAQVWAIAGGVVFNIGNLLLTAAVSLVGMSAAFPLSVGIALIVTSVTSFRSSNLLLLALGIACCLSAVFLQVRACLQQHPAGVVPKSANLRSRAAPRPIDQRRMRTIKGLIAGIFGGIFLGFFYQLAATGINGEFGLGPYAGGVLFATGILGSSIAFLFIFVNVAIEGPPLRFSSYFRGTFRQHLLGWGGGAIWTGGMLSALLANAAPPEIGLGNPVRIGLPAASALLYVIWGLVFWREFSKASVGAKSSLALGAALLAGAIMLVAIGVAA